MHQFARKFAGKRRYIIPVQYGSYVVLESSHKYQAVDSTGIVP